MSLINDALKRASKSIKQRESRPADTIRLQPVESAPRPSPYALIAVPLLLLGLVGFASWFFWGYFRGQRPDASPSTATTKPIIVATKASLPPPPPVVPVTNPHSPAASPPSTMPATTPVPVTPTVAASPPPARVSFPDLKLQGIYFRRVRPSVLINGHNVYAGELVDGAKVIVIERQSVTVEWEGQRRVLHAE